LYTLISGHQSSRYAQKANQLITWRSGFEDLDLELQTAMIKSFHQQFVANGGDLNHLTANSTIEPHSLA